MSALQRWIASTAPSSRSVGRCVLSGKANDHEFDDMVDACRRAHEVVKEHGSAEMQAFTTALLHALAKEAARRSIDGCNSHDA